MQEHSERNERPWNRKKREKYTDCLDFETINISLVVSLWACKISVSFFFFFFFTCICPICPLYVTVLFRPSFSRVIFFSSHSILLLSFSYDLCVTKTETIVISYQFLLCLFQFCTFNVQREKKRDSIGISYRESNNESIHIIYMSHVQAFFMNEVKFVLSVDSP